MKKKILFVSIFILITIVAFFIVSSFSHSNLRFKIYFSNVEEYQEDEYQGQLNYYLSDDDTIFYFDYRSNNTFLKQLDLKTGDKKEIISLKEHTNFDQEFIFAESLDYYNVIYNNNYLRYNKLTYEIETFDFESNSQIIFSKENNNIYTIKDNFIFSSTFQTPFQVDFNINQGFLINDNTLLLTDYDNQLYLLSLDSQQLNFISSHHLGFTYDSNNIYCLYRDNNKLKISTFLLNGDKSKDFSIENINFYSIFSRNGFIYLLSEIENGGELNIINSKNKKLSEKVKITINLNSKMNFDNLMITSSNTLFIGIKKTEHDFDLNKDITTHQLWKFN